MGLAVTYAKADPWVEFTHREFEEFRREQLKEAACLQRAAEEAQRKAQGHKSESNIMEAMVKKAEAYCHKTWQEATFEDILIETATKFGDQKRGQRRREVLRRTVRALINRGLVDR